MQVTPPPGDMAATISQPREFDFGGAKRRNGS
jgi:hypothetical protein